MFHEIPVWQELKKAFFKIHQALVKTRDLTEAIHGLRLLLNDWNAVVVRPYRDITHLDRYLRAAVRLAHAEEEAGWIAEHR